MICQIVSPKVKYTLTLNRRVSVIKGKSGIGKSHMVQILERSDDIHYYVCDRKIAVVPPNLQADIDSWLCAYRGFVLFADENAAWAHTAEFADKARENGCWLVIISRSLTHITARYSVRAVYTIHESGKYRWNVPYYSKSEALNPTLPIYTEDSKSGFTFLSKIFKDTVSIGGKDKFLRMGTLLYNHNVVADGAAFGQILSKYQVEYTLGKINFVLPESFEWLLLQSGIFEGITGKVEEPENNGANGSQYDTWENYFEDLLNKLMLENGAHGYSKSGDMRCFLQDCCYKDIPCDLRKLPACVKINNILKLLGVGMEL